MRQLALQLVRRGLSDRAVARAMTEILGRRQYSTTIHDWRVEAGIPARPPDVYSEEIIAKVLRLRLRLRNKLSLRAIQQRLAETEARVPTLPTLSAWINCGRRYKTAWAALEAAQAA